VISQAAISKLRRLMEAREKRDEDKKAAEASEKDYRAIEAEVFEEFEEAAVQGTVKVDLGEPFGVVSFRTRETYYGTIIDEEAAAEYYEQRAMMDEVSAPKFVMRRINEEVRDRIEQGQSMPPGVSFRANRGVTITRSK
jgi:hypothetical protein